MNKGLAHILVSKIGILPFIDLYAGIVATQEKQEYDDTMGSKSTIITRFPVSCDVVDLGDCPETDKLVPIIPDSKRKGILYFEDNGCDSLGRSSVYQTYRSSLRLVCWINTSFINLNACYEITMPVMTAIISKLTMQPFNQSNYLKTIVSVSKIPRTGKEIFDKYTYDLAVNQYLMPPFEYFALDLQVTFSMLPDCINNVPTKIPEQC